MMSALFANLVALVAKLVKGMTLYITILACVTALAAVIGCLFLSNGRIAYLFDPTDLFNFLWQQRAGLKVMIAFVTTSIFFLLAEDGILGRTWVPRRINSALRKMRRQMQGGAISIPSATARFGQSMTMRHPGRAQFS